MRPAFSSTKQAAAFALLLLLILLSPVLAGRKFLPPREQAYSTLGWNNGAYPWIYNQIFEETNDIDIAIVGSSHIWQDLGTPYLQQKLSEKLHRPAVVRTIAWGGAGYDALFFVTRDLLAHRHVRMLVIYDDDSGPCSQNPAAPAWFRFGEDAAVLPGLSAREQGLLYFAAIVGMPRNLLSLLHLNLPAPLVTDRTNYWTLINNTPNPATQLGCLSMRSALGLPFEPFSPATTARPVDAVIYSPGTKTDFEFSTAPLPAWQAYFVRRLAAMLREHGVQPVMLYLPVLAEARSPVISERVFWPDAFQTGVAMVGIPPAKLFGNLKDAELRKIYADVWHFNQNGQEYFTSLITPALIQLYENQSNH